MKVELYFESPPSGRGFLAGAPGPHAVGGEFSEKLALHFLFPRLEQGFKLFGHFLVHLQSLVPIILLETNFSGPPST